ncbi:hypothetical protein AGR7B_Lc60053 [Agrobacterium deltaense RV3]|nr:hypothetical protein AGR7B_Lc60053 [Agrobacterium deltaense RV3]
MIPCSHIEVACCRFHGHRVKVVREHGVTVAQAARDLDVPEDVRKWVREGGDDPSHSFPGKG